MTTTTRVVLTVEYDGRHYHGFQLQADLSTIQAELERALHKLTGERRRVMSASRTDAGVHARAQVVSFKTQSTLGMETFIAGLNYYLSRDIAVKEAHRAVDSFNVRRCALSREYNYYILNTLTRSPLVEGRSYFVAEHLDVTTMDRACHSLIGVHDFASFTNSIGARTKSTVRRVYQARVERDREMVIFNIVASSFLTHQVRNTVGSLIKIGLGKMGLDDFYDILETRKPGLAGPTAPACGLFLMQVNYSRSFDGELR